MIAIKTLPIVERWHCAGCARCCRGSIIHISPAERARIQAHDWSADSLLKDVKQWSVGGGLFSGDERLAQRNDGSCVFLTNAGRCRIHEVLGEEAKPLVCRMFPLQLVPGKESSTLTLRRSCPTAARDDGPEVSTRISQVRLWMDGDVALQGRQSPPSVWQGGITNWNVWSAFAQALEDLLADARFPLVRRLVHALNMSELLEQCKLSRLSENQLLELCGVLKENCYDVGDLFVDRVPPSRSGGVIFRQVANEYLRLHPQAELKSSWRERLRLMKASFSIVRGKGNVPRWTDKWSEVKWSELERPMGNPPEPVQRPLLRYFETHAASRQFALVGRSHWPLIDAFRALAMTFAVGMWSLRRISPTDMATVDQMVDVVTMLERGQGYASLVGGNHLRRLRTLTGLGQLSRLIIWYAR